MRIRLKAPMVLHGHRHEAGEIVDLPDGMKGPHRTVRQGPDCIDYDPANGIDANHTPGRMVDEPLYDVIEGEPKPAIAGAPRSPFAGVGNVLAGLALAAGLLLAALGGPAQAQGLSNNTCNTNLCGLPTKVLSAATTNSTSIKAAPGALYLIAAGNTNTAAAYLKLYDKATAPTCNSDTVKFTVLIPGTAAGTDPPPLVLPFPIGLGFNLGIGLCITAAQADNDNTAATTGITVGLQYR